MKPGFQKPRSHTILAITKQAIADRNLVVLNFAAAVAEHYLSVTEPADRVVKFRDMVGDTEQLLAAQRHNAQTVDRYIKGLVKSFPADLEEIWVHELPEQYRVEVERQLAARYGMLPTRMPSASPREQLMTFHKVMRSFGNAFESCTPVYADGKVDESDAPFLHQAIRDIDNHVASCIQARIQMVAVADAIDGAHSQNQAA